MRAVCLRRLLPLSLLGGILAVGCGQAALDSSTSPSPVVQSAPPGAGGSVAFNLTSEAAEALKNGNGNNNNGELSGFVTATSTDSITIRGIVVEVVADTVIRHGHTILTLADISVGDHAQARGHRNTDGTITATEIKVEHPGEEDDEEEEGDDEEITTTNLKGSVAALTGSPSCPSVRFTIGTEKVKTNSSTVFDDVTCAALANGNTVEVTGTTQTEGAILATKVELESGPNQVDGTISGVTSTAACPVLSFTVGTNTVTTSASTTYTGVTCATLANGQHVEVEGTLSGTTIAAASIELH